GIPGKQEATTAGEAAVEPELSTSSAAM
ncbi:MAG: hypothetical protein JWR24_4125, partial [Actinoallomurus sp.]|nr:hypothetical protein [Actinoallomurus sp.]